MEKKPIIIIGVLCLISLGLGYWYGMPKKGSGGVGNGDPKPSAFLKQGLVAYYPFNGNAKDESGNGHDGDVKGATLANDRNGNSNSAYYFDGADDYINLGNDDDFNFGESDFSISLWFQTSVNQT